MKKLSKVFMGAHQALIKKGWGQRAMENGDGQLCALGGLRYSISGDRKIYQMTENEYNLFVTAKTLIVNQLLDCGVFVGYSGLGGWNDCHERTVTEVLDMFDEATSMAMSDESME